MTTASTTKYSICMFQHLDESSKELIKCATEARKHAYCPYSKFAVGAALKSVDGDGAIFKGCNVESGVMAPSVCAERSAVCTAVTQGHRKFTAVAVVADQESGFTAPCGVCRETLIEFAKGDMDMDVYLCKPEMNKVMRLKLNDLLPLAFVRDFL